MSENLRPRSPLWRILPTGKTPSKLVNDGIALADEKRYVEAIAAFTEALDIDPSSAIAAIAWGRKGNCFVSLNQYEDAVDCYDRALEINPAYSSIWYIKGFVLGLLGQREEAIQSLDRAIEQNPEHHLAWRAKGECLQALGRYSEALACLTKVRDLHPQPDERLDQAIVFCRSMTVQSSGAAKAVQNNGATAANSTEVADLRVYEETIKQFLAGLEKAQWRVYEKRIEQGSADLERQIDEERTIIRELSAIVMEEQELVQKLMMILEIQTSFIERLLADDESPPKN